MNILLASLKTLPKLVNGKVAVINSDNTYTLYSVSRFCSISDDFNPLNYALLVSDKYPKCVIHAETKDKEYYLVNSQLNKVAIRNYGKGDSIHIHSRRGIYTVSDYTDSTITITCKKWQYEEKESDRVRIIPASDFKCLAGGIYNANFQ